jgi:hypothetical protein
MIPFRRTNARYASELDAGSGWVPSCQALLKPALQ